MLKIVSYLFALAVVVSLVACGGGAGNGKDVSSYSTKIAKYAGAKDLKSLQSLGDTIIADETLGEDVVKQLNDTTAEISSAALAVSVSPEKAANIIFEYVKSMKKEDKPILRARVKSLLNWYSDMKQDDKSKKFRETLDSLALSLDIDKQAQCYVMVATSPAFLAGMVKAEGGENKEELIKAIEKAYSDNEAELTQFRNALK